VSIKILLVDDHKLFREGLRFLLEKQKDFVVVGEAQDGREAVKLAKEEEPDIVLMDVEMPNMNGIEAAQQIRSRCKNTRILALTMHSDKNYVTAMLRVGVAGYVLKDCDAKELVNAVREVVAGRGYISPEVAPLILEDYSGQRNAAGGESELSSKEIEVLRLLSDGLNIKDIAEKLDVSGKTIERYRNQIMEKLKLHSIAELTKYAVKKGISSLS
jgi:DNA-binding NarL/FixJ family response regulator